MKREITSITSININLRGREIKLTSEEARALQKELNLLFELEKSELEKFKKQWESEHPPTVPYPVPVYPSPIFIERQQPCWPRPWEVVPWCGTEVTCSPQGSTLCIDVK